MKLEEFQDDFENKSGKSNPLASPFKKYKNPEGIPTKGKDKKKDYSKERNQKRNYD